MLPSRAAPRGLRQDAAASDPADPYLAGYARLQQATALLSRRRRRDATGVLRYADQAARRLVAPRLCAQIALAHEHQSPRVTTGAEARPSLMAASAGVRGVTVWRDHVSGGCGVRRQDTGMGSLGT